MIFFFGGRWGGGVIVRTPDIDIIGNIVINSHSLSNVTPCDSILPYAQVLVLLKICHGGAIPPWCGGNQAHRHGRLHLLAEYRGRPWQPPYAWRHGGKYPLALFF